MSSTHRQLASGFKEALLLSILAALCTTRDAKAALQVALEPVNPVSGQPVSARIISNAGPQCLPPVPLVAVVGQDVSLKVVVTDECDPVDVVSSRTYLVGSFDEGLHVLHAEFCVDNPPPFQDDCGPIGDVSFRVRGAALLSAPANSWYAVVALFACIAMAMAKALSERRAK